MRKKSSAVLMSAVSAALLIMVCMYVFSNKITDRTYCVESPLIDAELRFALLSDLHSDISKGNLVRVKESLGAASPDAVLLCGDILDKQRDFTDAALELLHWLGQNYRCFYVSGNHEGLYPGRLDIALGVMRKCGITALDARSELFYADEAGIPVIISGAGSPIYYGSLEQCADSADALENEWIAQNGGGACLKLLLAHHPEYHDEYEKYDFDIVLSGHAHGGQVRVPGILNGLYSPGEGLFPKYAGGRYPLGSHSVLIVSRGLCVNALPRVFNRPEIVYVDVKP